MTVKGNRAKALRKMGRKEAASYNTGGWVDDSFPAGALRNVLAAVAGPIDVAAFDGFFGPRLARYRATLEWQHEQPSTATELDLLREACEAIEQVRMRLEHLPPAAGDRIQSITWNRRHEFFNAFRRRLDDGLVEARNLLWLTEREVEEDGGKAGRKPVRPRDFLLYEVAHWLMNNGSIRKTKACEIAASVLRAAAVPAPDDPKEAGRCVRAVEKEVEEINRN